MDRKLVNQLSNLPDTPKDLDPLQRVFVPIEKQTSDGRTVFQTLDRAVYERRQNGQIINHSKFHGTAKQRKKLRMQARKKATVIQHADN